MASTAWAPSPATASGSTDFTVAFVPTAMKAGVRMIGPCGVWMTPVRPRAPLSRPGCRRSKPTSATRGHGLQLRQRDHTSGGRAQHRVRRSGQDFPPACRECFASSASVRTALRARSTNMISPNCRRHRKRGQRARSAVSWQHRSASGRLARPAATSSAVVASASDTVGTRNRRHCLAASRAVARQRVRPRSTRSGGQRTTDRSACQGTISSMPSSVSISTASSARSPFGQTPGRPRSAPDAPARAAISSTADGQTWPFSDPDDRPADRRPVAVADPGPPRRA